MHTELQALSESERRSELVMAGFDESTTETIGLYLSAMPLLNIAVKLEADEDDGDIQQGDVGHCKVGVLDMCGGLWCACVQVHAHSLACPTPPPAAAHRMHTLL